MKKTAFLYIVLASIFWGTSGIFVNFIAPYGINSFQMTFIRSFIFFICMGGYILLTDRKLFKASKKELVFFALDGIAFFLTASCYFYSMQLTSISTAVVLMYTAPVFVMIYSVLFLSEKFNKLKGISVGLMIIGCALVSGIIGGLKLNALGILIGFASGLSFSAYNIITKIQMRNNSNPLTATFYCFLFATLLGMFVVRPLDIPGYLSADLSVSLPLTIGMGICTCVLPYLLYTIALKYIPAGTASSLGIIEPMAATIFSVILFKEPLSIYSIVGIILILSAVFLLSKADN